MMKINWRTEAITLLQKMKQKIELGGNHQNATIWMGGVGCFPDNHNALSPTLIDDINILSPE